MILKLLRGEGPPTGDDLRSDLRKMCSVFLHRESERCVIATKFQTPERYGLYFESDDAVTVTDSTPGDAFGEAVRDAFIASHRRANDSLGERKSVKDWPALKASKAKSKAQFDREWICITVQGANEANIIVRMETDPVEHGVSLTKHCNPLVVERLGGDLILLKKQYLKWERA